MGTVGRMTPPVEAMIQLRRHIQQAVVRACEHEVTYKCSLQIFGILCLSIDGDEDNELVIKIQKKWYKASKQVPGDANSVSGGVNTIHECCDDNRRLSECCEQTERSADQEKTSCDMPELVDNFPRCFRPIPSSEMSFQRNPLMSTAGVGHGFRLHPGDREGDFDSPKSYPLCPYDLCSDSNDIFLERPGTVAMENKAGSRRAFVKHCTSDNSPLAGRSPTQEDGEDTQRCNAHPKKLIQQQRVVENITSKATTCDATAQHWSVSRELSSSSGRPSPYSCMRNMCSNVTVPVVCDTQPASHIFESDPLSVPRPDRLLSATSTGIPGPNFAGSTRLYGDSHYDAPAEQKMCLLTPKEVLKPTAAGNGHRSMLSHKLFALTSFTDAKLYGTARAGRNRTGKVRKRTPVGARGRKLLDRPLVGQRTMAQCFGITKNKRLTYTTEEQVELEHGGFARTMQRLLCRPPLRAIYKEGVQSDMDGPLHQSARPVSNVVLDDVPGESVMKNVQSINNQELDMSVNGTAGDTLNSGELDCVGTVWNDVDKTREDVTILQCGQDCCPERNTVTTGNDTLGYGTTENRAQNARTSEIQDGGLCEQKNETLSLIQPDSGTVGVEHSDIAELQAHDIVNSETNMAPGVYFGSRQLKPAAPECTDKDEYGCVSVSNSRIDSEVSVKEYESLCDEVTAVVTEVPCTKEQNMSSNIVTDSNIDLCKHCLGSDGKVMETVSGNAEVSIHVAQSDGCTNETHRTVKCCCSVEDTKNRMTSLPIVGGTASIQAISGITEEVQDSVIASCKTESSEYDSNQKLPVKSNLIKSETPATECMHHELKVRDLQENHDTDYGASILYKHTPVDGTPAKASHSNKMMPLAGDCCSNLGSVEAVPERSQRGTVTCDKQSVMTIRQCQDACVDSGCLCVSDIAADTHSSTDRLCPRSNETSSCTHPVTVPVSAMSREQNLTPGKHVRNLFPESRTCGDFTTSKEAMCHANKDLSLGTTMSVTGSLLGNEDENKLDHVNADKSSSLASGSTESLQDAASALSAEGQKPAVQCDDVQSETSIISEDPFPESNIAAILSTSGEDALVRRPMCRYELMPKLRGFETSHTCRPNALSRSVRATTGVNGVLLVSPLTRPPINRSDKKVSTSVTLLGDDGVGSLLMPAQTEESQMHLCRGSKHTMLPTHNKEERIQHLNGLSKCDRQHGELEKVPSENVTGAHTASISLGHKLSSENPQPDCCYSEVADAMTQAQKKVSNGNSEEFHLHGDEVGMKAFSIPSTHGSSDTSGHSATVTESLSACSDSTNQLVGVTGSWTVVTDPALSNSLVAMSRPLVTVTSFSNIQFKDVTFNSAADKNDTVSSEAVYLPCSVKENRGDGPLKKVRWLQTPKSKRTDSNRDRWKWPANLLRTISRKSHVVTKRHLETTSETMYIDKMRLKGRWSRKWKPSTGSP